MSTKQDDGPDSPPAAALAGHDVDRLRAPAIGQAGIHEPEVGCQFSVYPLRQDDIDGPVQAAIHAVERRALGERG